MKKRVSSKTREQSDHLLENTTIFTNLVCMFAANVITPSIPPKPSLMRAVDGRHLMIILQVVLRKYQTLTGRERKSNVQDAVVT